MFPVITISPETIAHMDAIAADESAYQRDVLQARNYDAGVQFVQLTDRLRQFLGGDTGNTSEDFNRLRVNVTKIVTASVVERLLVSGFDSNEIGVAMPVLDDTGAPKTDAAGSALMQTVKPIAGWAWEIWQANRMDAKQKRVHYAACRDSEAFVIVDWDTANNRPRFTPHERYIDQSLASESFADVGEGCRAFYRNDDPDQDLLYVTKRWTEVFYTGDLRQQRERLTIYFPDRILKYTGYVGAWAPTWDADVRIGAGGFDVVVDGMVVGHTADSAQAQALAQQLIDSGALPWPIAWLDAAGQPLGIPVAHFRSSAGMEAKEAWPCQNAINYLSVLELTSADMTAFRILVAIGWEPIVGGSKTPANPAGTPLTIAPGTWVGTSNKDGKVQDIPPADIGPISDLIDAWIFRCAMVTETPVTRFITTKQVAAEGTLKQQDGPLINRVRDRQGELGNAWEDALSIARRLANRFGGAALDEGVLLYTKWEPAEVRDEGAELANGAKKQSLGVPQSQIWAELGYSQEKIAAWEATAQAEKAAERAAMAQRPVAAGGVANGA